mgnify:FL=1
MTATPKLCFVIMPFSEERMEVFTHGIAPACEKAGFAAVRVDQLKGHFNINRKIIEHIFSSDAVIAEITDKNPNVFYEMGVAHSIGNKTIMVAQNAKDLPFDIRNYRCLIYEQSETGLQQLQKQIVESLQELEKWGQSPSNPVQDFKPEDAFIPKSKAELLRRQLEQQVHENEKLMRNSIAPVQWQKLQADYQQLQDKLKSKEQITAQQATEVVALQKEVESLRTRVPSPKLAQPPKPNHKLRTEPNDNLSEEDVKQMLRNQNFYDRDYYTEGKGIAHQYERIEREGAKLVADHLTGLTWEQVGSAKPMTYTKVEEYVRELNKKRFAGYNDWRLPTLEEVMSLMEREEKHGDLYIAPEFDKTQRWIWTADQAGTGWAWVVYFTNGSCDLVDVGYNAHVRAVR